MNQRWWIAIVAVVGIGLAVLLFPRPDTGGALPTSAPSGDRLALENGKDGPAASGVNPSAVGKPRPPIDPDRVRTGVKPGMEARAAMRNRPEVIYASKVITPFSAMRYWLMKEGSEPAKVLAEEIGSLMNGDLRKIRLDPDSLAWADLEKSMDETVAHLQASPFSADESMQKSLGRYKEFVAEYHSAKSTEGAAPAPTVTTPPAGDIPPGAPPGTPPAEPVEE